MKGRRGLHDDGELESGSRIGKGREEESQGGPSRIGEVFSAEQLIQCLVGKFDFRSASGGVGSNRALRNVGPGYVRGHALSGERRLTDVGREAVR